MPDNLINLLLVEDNPADTELIHEIIEETSKNKFKIDNIDNGNEAMKYLLKEGEYENAITPDLIILDLNLPLKSGKEILREIKQNKTISSIPVIIVSSSTLEKEIKTSYEMGASSYLVKSLDLKEFKEKIKALLDFWINRLHKD